VTIPEFDWAGTNSHATALRCPPFHPPKVTEQLKDRLLNGILIPLPQANGISSASRVRIVVRLHPQIQKLDGAHLLTAADGPLVITAWMRVPYRAAHLQSAPADVNSNAAAAPLQQAISPHSTRWGCPVREPHLY